MTLFAGAGLAVSSERIDSVSYAFGHQYTLAIMAGKNDMMQTEQKSCSVFNMSSLPAIMPRVY